MNRAERVKMVKAMEYIVRNLNNENYILHWLTAGVPDGSIEYGDLSPDANDDVEYLIEDENFSDLMTVFLMEMSYAGRNGGLYCDNVLSEI